MCAELSTVIRWMETKGVKDRRLGVLGVQTFIRVAAVCQKKERKHWREFKQQEEMYTHTHTHKYANHVDNTGGGLQSLICSPPPHPLSQSASLGVQLVSGSRGQLAELHPHSPGLYKVHILPVLCGWQQGICMQRSFNFQAYLQSSEMRYRRRRRWSSARLKRWNDKQRAQCREWKGQHTLFCCKILFTECIWCLARCFSQWLLCILGSATLTLESWETV